MGASVPPAGQLAPSRISRGGEITDFCGLVRALLWASPMSKHSSLVLWVFLGLVANRSYSDESIPLRAALRETVIASSFRIPSEPEEDDQARDLVDQMLYERLEDIERAQLLKASLPEAPWSDSYWPIYQGSLANRYADPAFPGSMDWKENFDFLFKRIGEGASDRLSPAEKYDLLVGDTNFTLTKRMLEEGRRIYEQDGKVETWMGICHGWAPASFMAPRATKAVRASALAGGGELLFYPSDIKALTSLLWANARVPTRYIGGRCHTRQPPTDPNGRPEKIECLDSNPGTWHLAVVNQIGVSKRSFILDASFDYEVWNQPVVSYEYRYFDLKTKKPTDDLKSATVARTEFAEDPFRGTRSPRATHLVGISMEVTYMVETRPSTELTDSEAFDLKRTAQYIYDLELDAHGAIVGGEWHSQNHPDFLWTPAPNTQPVSQGDLLLQRVGDLRRWSPRTKVPVSWTLAARRASAIGQPLARMVEGLLQASRAD